MNAMDTMVESNSVILYAGGAFLLAFVCSVLGRFNALEQRVSPVTVRDIVFGTGHCFWDSGYLCHFSTEMAEIWSPGTFFEDGHTKCQLSITFTFRIIKLKVEVFSDFH